MSWLQLIFPSLMHLVPFSPGPVAVFSTAVPSFWIKNTVYSPEAPAWITSRTKRQHRWRWKKKQKCGKRGRIQARFKSSSNKLPLTSFSVVDCRTVNLGKDKSGGECIYVSNFWCTTEQYCTPDLKFITLKCSVSHFCFHSSQANAKLALTKLHDAINYC